MTRSTEGGTQVSALLGEIQVKTYAALAADLYARWTLDSVVEIANAVATDFVARPEFYRAQDVPDGIVDLRMAYGYASKFPNRAQRQSMAQPIFGASDGYSGQAATDKFRALRKPLFDACTTFAERTVTESIEGLRQRILSALRLFQAQLRNFDGVSIRASYQQIQSVSDLAYSVLRSAGISQVFGVVTPPRGTWPIDNNDPAGALLIRAIGEKLTLAPEHVFNEDHFQRLQRVAQQGRDALQLILVDGDPAVGDANFDQLVTSVYTWSTALTDLWGH